MPIFEYECTDCKIQATQFVRQSENEPKECESCGGSLRRLISVFSVKGGQASSDPLAMRSTSSDFLKRPERFGEAMNALGERTGVKFDNERVDDAMHRLSQAKKQV